MKSHSDNDALAIRQAARRMLLTKSGDKLEPKQNLTVAELRAASVALSIAQKMEMRTIKDAEEFALSSARDWFLSSKDRTIQEAADKFGAKYAVVRQRAYAEDWISLRDEQSQKN